MIIRPTIYTAKPDAWREFVLACGAVPIIDGETWSVYGLGRGRLGIQLAGHEPAGSASVSIETIRLDKFSSPYTQLSQPGERPDLTVIGEDLPELLVENLEGEAERGGELSAAPLLMTSRVKDNVLVLESLGLELRTINESGTYADFSADGIIALHDRGASNHDSERVQLSFEHPDLDALENLLVQAGFDPTIVNEDYGRSLRVGVGNEQAWVNETPTDFYASTAD